MEFSKSHDVRRLAYALENTFNDALGDDEIAEAIKDQIEQLRYNAEYARSLKESWVKVLKNGNSCVAQDLVLNWARQGKREPEAAIEQLKEWFEAFDPLWREL